MSEFIHIVSRGVDKRKIFMDEEDHFRFIHDLFEFNDEENVENNRYLFNKGFVNPYIERKPRKLIVHLHVFCLMSNHYHLLLTPLGENTTSHFMKKLNTGYANYFNKKYKRKGALFEGRYKPVFIKDEAHFIHLPYYIHLNPLDFKFPTWRERRVKNHKEAMKFLESYRWSSHQDYLGKKNFPSVTQRETLLEVFNGEKGYKKQIDKWLKCIEWKENSVYLE